MIQREWKRVFGTRSTLLVMLLFLVVQAILLVYSEGQSTKYSAKAYREAWKEVEALLAVEEPEAVLERLNRHIEKLEFIECFVEIGVGDFYEQAADWLGEKAQVDLYAQLQEEYPSIDSAAVLRAYRAGTMVRHTKRPSVEKQLYKDIFVELQNVTSYAQYRETLISDAERLLRLPLFLKQGTFGYRNVQATLKQYRTLPEVATQPVAAKGAATLFQGSMSGILLLFFLGYLCIPLYLSEKEEGTTKLTRTCVKGRKPLARAKLMVFFAGIFVMQCLLYGVRYLILDILYGFPELSLSIQSISGFQGCALPLAIWQYFLATFFLRYGILCLAALFMAFFCSLCSNTKKAYAWILGFFFVQAALYYLISANASYGALHFLNIWGMLRFDVMGSYLNLNLFGKPVFCLYAVIASLALGIPVFGWLSVRLFCRKPKEGQKTKRNQSVPFPKLPSTSVYVHEGRKLFFDQKVLLFLLVVFIIQSLRYRDTTVSYSVEEYYYRYYMELLSGPLTEEKEVFLEKEALRFQKLHQMDQTNSKVQKALNAELGFQDAYNRYLHLKRTEAGEFFYDSGYRYLLAERTYKTDVFFMVTAVVLFTLTGTGVFCKDAESGMLQLLTTTRNGKKGICARLLWGGVLAVGVWLLVYLPDFLCTLKQYGTQGLLAPAQSIILLAGVEQLLVWEYLVLLYLLRFVGLLLVSGVMYLLAYFTKSTALTVFGSFGVFAIPALLYLLNEKMLYVMAPYAPFSGNLLRRYPGVIGVGLVLFYIVFVWISYQFMIKRRKITISLFTNEEE